MDKIDWHHYKKVRHNGMQNTPDIMSPLLEHRNLDRIEIAERVD